MSAPFSRKCVIVIVHGAWHRPLHYIRLVDALVQLGYIVEAPANPTAGCGQDDGAAEKSHVDDTAHIRQTIKPHLEAGREVLLVCHSYGAVPGTQACKGMSVQEQAAIGLRGGIKAIVYVASVIVNERGRSLASYRSAEPVTWQACKMPFIELAGNASEVLYSDIDELSASLAFSSTVKQSAGCGSMPVEFIPRDSPVSKTYVVCEKDLAVPFEQQMKMARDAGAEIRKIDCGHSPFLRADALATLVGIIQEVATTR